MIKTKFFPIFLEEIHLSLRASTSLKSYGALFPFNKLSFNFFLIPVCSTLSHIKIILLEGKIEPNERKYHCVIC